MSQFVSLALALSLFCSALAQEPSRAQPVRVGLHTAFDQLLRRHVHDERVDYLALRDDDAEQLKAYLDRLDAIDPHELEAKARLVFYLNLYNATMIQAVIDRFVAAYLPSAGEFAVFSAPLVRIKGKKVSLNHLENEVIRKQFSEPRIHVALVCGARSCPSLLPRAYRVDDLEALLERQMKRFVNDAERNTLGEKRVKLSKIFEWYSGDFGAAGVLAYVGRYAKVHVGKAEVGYREYSWALNIAAPRHGSWMAMTKELKGLRKGEVCRVLEREDGRVQLLRPGGGSVWVPSGAATPHRFAR